MWALRTSLPYALYLLQLDQMRSQLGGAGSRWPLQHAACGLPISARGSRRRRLLLLLLAACSLLAAAVGCLLASCFSVHQRWTASRLRTPIKHPLCITSNFSNFSNFLLACQQLFPGGYGHFDRRNDLEPALRAKSAASGNHASQRLIGLDSRSDHYSRHRTR